MTTALTARQRISFIKAADAAVREVYPKSHFRKLGWWIADLKQNSSRTKQYQALVELEGKARDAGNTAVNPPAPKPVPPNKQSEMLGNTEVDWNDPIPF